MIISFYFETTWDLQMICKNNTINSYTLSWISSSLCFVTFAHCFFHMYMIRELSKMFLEKLLSKTYTWTIKLSACAKVNIFKFPFPWTFWSTHTHMYIRLSFIQEPLGSTLVIHSLFPKYFLKTKIFFLYVQYNYQNQKIEH